MHVITRPALRSVRLIAWLGAGLIFATVILCGSFTAAYTGWEWVSRRLPDGVASGRVDTLAAPTPGAAPAVFVVMTATPQEGIVPPPIAVPGNGADTALNTGDNLQFPEAVTPTPITINPGGEALPPVKIGRAHV